MTLSTPFSQGSRLVQRLRRRYPKELALLPSGQPWAAQLEITYAHLCHTYSEVADALRVLRHLVLERLVVLDCEQQAPLNTITQSMTTLAEFTLNKALQEALARVDLRHGPPMTSQGTRAELWVIGMGKLGAGELNVSSDIDLVYVFDEDGQTEGIDGGGGVVSNHSYFDKVVKQLYALIGETTEHGQVFRMDLGLRPNGESGYSVVSLDALEEYFQVQGREWERLAWLKARVVAPAARMGQVKALLEVVTPFVFRRYLDYNVFEALRVLHQQIRAQSLRLSAGRPERANDVKLGRGGIREIEFTVQLLQVVRGGQFPELRQRATLDTLDGLVKARLMPADTAKALHAAYVFLRQVEHRIQYLDDQQTHRLPSDPTDLQWIAHTLGLTNSEALLQALQQHRDRVAQEFELLLGQGESASPNTANPQPPVSYDWASVLEGLSPLFRQRMAAWPAMPRVLALREDTRERLLRLVQRTQTWLDQGLINEEAALRWSDWMEPLLRRETYLALLLERPPVHQQLLRLLGSSRWAARYLRTHPGVIDELANTEVLDERFNAAQMRRHLQARHDALVSQGADDEESLLNVLRRAHHGETLLTLARDVEGRLSVEQVADDLSLLADTLVEVAALWVWSRLKTRHRDLPCFAVLGYGKWGGKELGYGSDLDIVFIYHDEHPQAGEIYAGFARKLIRWLTIKTGEGDVYEIDTALRPNGNAGLLVSSWESFADYQRQRGSNTAWVWEHQAMTRARFCVGDERLRQPFEAVRREVLCASRDPQALAVEVVLMRDKMRAAQAVKPDIFDFKHSPGGMIDAEFAVQFLVLAHAQRHTGLVNNVGNIALLEHAQTVGLLPHGMGQAAADAYRLLRHWQHLARLDEATGERPLVQVREQHDAIAALWHFVFS